MRTGHKNRRFLPHYSRRNAGVNSLSTEEVVALIDRAFTAGYAAADAGKYLRSAKRRFLENLAVELRQSSGD